MGHRGTADGDRDGGKQARTKCGVVKMVERSVLEVLQVERREMEQRWLGRRGKRGAIGSERDEGEAKGDRGLGNWGEVLP